MPRTAPSTQPLPAPARRWASLQHAAAYADIGYRTVRRHVANGKLPAYRIGRRLLVDLNEVDALAVPVPTGEGGAA